MAKSYKQKYNNEDGVWRTIGGRRVFIRTGQSLSDAMKESGKFKQGNRREVQQAIAEEKVKKLGKKNEELYKEYGAFADTGDKEKNKVVDKAHKKWLENAKEANELKDMYNDYSPLGWEKDTYNNPKPYSGPETPELAEAKHTGLQFKGLTEEGKRIASGNFKSQEEKEMWEKAGKETEELLGGKDKSYTRKDGTKEYDPYKGTKFEKKYDSVDDVIKDPDSALNQYINDKEIAKRVKENKIVDSFENNVVYQNDKGNWITSRESYNDYVNGKKDRLGGELVLNEKQARETLASYDALDKYPYEGYVRDQKTGNDKKYEQQKKENLEKMYKTIGYDDSKYNYGYEREDSWKQNDDGGFTQHIDMHGGTQEYSKEDLKRMEEAGIRPMEHSYTGGGWEGVNSRKNLSTTEQAKAITDTIKEKYPDVKISRRSDNYSMSSSIDFNVMSSVRDLYVSEKDIDNMTDFGRLSTSLGFETWAEKNVEGFKRYTNETYSQDDLRRYAKEALRNIKAHEDQNVRGDEWYLSDYGKKFISDLNKEANSYTYSDSDGMVDYFDHGTYMTVSIGKWNKPYQVSTNESDYKKLYNQYLKEHKGSNLSLEDFKKWYK